MPISIVEWDKSVDTELGTTVRVCVTIAQSDLESSLEATSSAVGLHPAPAAPFWPSQPWFCQLMSLLVDLLQIILPQDNLLKNSDVLSETRQAEADRMASVHRSFVQQGFSADVAEMVSKAM